MYTQYSEAINSTQYWNQRFIADWKENNGMEQSQFFSRIAVDHLPAWFIRYVQQHQPSFCDWGCAMGNGTKVLHDLLSLQNTTGIDFSRVAIEQARASYPAIRFIATDILRDESFPRFDIIFSSNTLEHFENPWDILEKLSCFAKKFLVILIPFQEYDRHFEHFYTFETTNIPSTIRASHRLTYFSIINAAEYPTNYWNGQQILLIYATHAEMAGLDLALSDIIDNKNIAPLAPKTPDPITTALTDCTQKILLLREQLDRTFDLLDKRLDATDCQLAKTTSEKEILISTIQSLQNEIQTEKKETAEKLLLLNTSLNAIEKSLSRDFITTIKNVFSKLTRSKNKEPHVS
ncbi:MAG TPA: class I SAM-dependent methyltransferase [Puia sp.]|nr:class I SAM-dependent methyltransferase [Puia sp.]HVV03852.1 class I SAM-dependent methyltransferase [Puia sp.]